MRQSLSIALCIALVQIGFGQYTYFNNVFGDSNDQASKFETCIELLDSTWYTWGGGVDGQFFNSVSTYSSSGMYQEDVIWTFPQSLVYLGETNSFQKIPNESTFLFSQAMEDVNGSHGLLMKIDSNLDTLWTSVIDIYPGQTSVITHAWDGNGFILAGEHGVNGVGNGTFIAKVDTQGQYLWHTILHEPQEGSYRNRFISVVENGYIVSGSQGGGLETEGQVEYYNSLSDELFTLVNNESAISRGIMSHVVRSNGEVIVTQPIRVTDYPGSANPSFAYSKSNLFRLDFVDMELELLAEHNGGGNWITGGAIKTIESSQDGLVQLGRTYLEINDSLRQVSFVTKLTEDYQVDWYTELSYEICSGCTNELYDIEQASDGGYVMVGKFSSPEDPYDKTWLVKVDACGDLEWQGCEPVGLTDWTTSASVSIFPNPANDFLRIEFSAANEAEIIELVDLSGRVVLDMLFENKIDVSSLGAGIYLLRILNTEGVLHSEKLLIE